MCKMNTQLEKNLLERIITHKKQSNEELQSKETIRLPKAEELKITIKPRLAKAIPHTHLCKVVEGGFGRRCVSSAQMRSVQP